MMEGVESSLDKIVCSEARYSILIQLFLLVVAPSPSAGLLHQQLLQACALTSLTYNIYISLYSEVSISFISFLLLYFSVFCFFCLIYTSLIFYYSCNPSCLFSSLFAIRIFFLSMITNTMIFSMAVQWTIDSSHIQLHHFHNSSTCVAASSAAMLDTGTSG